MAESTSTREGFSLKRWSRRKLEAAQSASPPATPAAPTPAPPSAVVATAPTTAPTLPAAYDAPVLPPVESLTHDSDFSAFMQPKVDEAIKRAALKKLFTDPHFNVMDGLDIYVGDYTQPDPMPDGMLEKLGKVYAAVTHPEDADTPVPAAAVLPDAVPVETTTTTTTAAGTAAVESAVPENANPVVDDAQVVPVELPTPIARSAVPAILPDPAAAIHPTAPARGKPQ